VTNLKSPAERVVKFYNGRGTAERWIREGKAALRWTRLSRRVFRANTVRLQLFALACDLANILQTLGAAARGRAVVADDLAREAGQGRRAARAPRPLRDLSAGPGGGAESAVRRDPKPDRPAARPARGGLAGANYGASSAEGRTMRQRSARPVGETGADPRDGPRRSRCSHPHLRRASRLTSGRSGSTVDPETEAIRGNSGCTSIRKI
jgi:hypothetical protein